MQKLCAYQREVRCCATLCTNTHLTNTRRLYTVRELRIKGERYVGNPISFSIYIYIYIYIYNQRRSKPAIISRIPCSVEIMGIENLITETPACVFRFNKITQSKLRNRKKGRLVYRYDVRVWSYSEKVLWLKNEVFMWKSMKLGWL